MSLHRLVLVLNASFEPINICSARRLGGHPKPTNEGRLKTGQRS
jgi:hypothetical protein